MGFLSGSIAFERFYVLGEAPQMFGPEHLEVLQRYASGVFDPAAAEDVQVGFLAGGHVFDQTFDLEKNIINDALHCAVRIDTNQIPAAIRNAWLQMELAALMAENTTGRPTKTQRQEAKEAVEQRCLDEARTGKYHKMQQFPVLWDARQNLVYVGSSSAAASEHCAGLVCRAFELELDRITAGTLAVSWAERTKRRAALDEINPSVFHADNPSGEIGWLNNMAGNFDFLGNEFLLWLWWYLETQSDTLALADDSEVTVMLTRTLSLECPRGETGKESITAEAPTKLPEARQAVRSGKLPRKTGLTLVRHGLQYDLVLQAETFAIGSARVHAEETDQDDDPRSLLDARIDAVRCLGETVDLMFQTFCEKRVSPAWNKDLDGIHRWLKADKAASRKPAA